MVNDRYMSQSNLIPHKAMLMTQRLKKTLYEKQFVDLIKTQLNSLKLKLHVFGFTVSIGLLLM